MGVIARSTFWSKDCVVASQAGELIPPLELSFGQNETSCLLLAPFRRARLRCCRVGVHLIQVLPEHRLETFVPARKQHDIVDRDLLASRVPVLRQSSISSHLPNALTWRTIPGP